MKLSSVAAGFACLLSFTCFSHSRAEALTIKHLIQQGPGAIPTMNLVKDHLVVGQNETHKTFVFELDAQSEVAHAMELPGGGGNTNIAVDASSGWAVSCYNLGQNLVYFNTDLLPKFSTYEFPDTDTFSCAGLALEMGSDARPRLWVGSPGDRTIGEMDLFNGEVINSFAPISGPFNIVKAAGNIFTLNQIVYPDNSVPYAFDATSGTRLIGEALGRQQNTRLTRGYNAEIFDDSKVSGRVYFVRTNEKLLHGFDAQHPSEDAMSELKLEVTRPETLARYGSCVVVMGRSEEEASQPQWSIYKVPTSTSSWQLVKTTDYLRDNSINGALRMVIDSHGALFISHWKGVSRVSGLFDGVDCSATR